MVVVAQRDWLLLRGRLRRFVSLAALPVMSAVMTMSAPGSASARTAEPAHASVPEARRATGVVEVIRWAGDTSRAGAARSAGALLESHPLAAAVTVSDVRTQGDADRLRDLLAALSGRSWRVRWFDKRAELHAPPASGQAILWCTDHVDLVEDFGTHVAGRDGRMGGLLLARRRTSSRIAVFTGRYVEESKETQLGSMRSWIDTVTARHARASRVVLVDAARG